MRQAFIWHNHYNYAEAENRNYTVVHYEFFKEHVPGEFTKGHRFDGFDPKYHVYLSEKKKDVDWADYLVPVLGPKLVSKRLMEFLNERAGNALQFIPIDVYADKKCVKPAGEYSILVNLGLVDCIDLAKTQHTIDPAKSGDKQVNILFQFKLDPERIDPSLKIFRLRYETVVTIVMEDLKKEMEAKGFTGLQFEEVEYS